MVEEGIEKKIKEVGIFDLESNLFGELPEFELTQEEFNFLNYYKNYKTEDYK